MNWHYSRDNQPAGPVDDAELLRLAQTGVVTGATLVWHGGMANWQPFESVRETLLAVPAPGQSATTAGAGGQAACSQCGRLFPADEVVRVGAHDVCAGCKPMLIQKLREGVVGSQEYAGSAVYAGFWIRFGAAFLDGLILVPIFLVIYGIVFYLAGPQILQMASNRSTVSTFTMQGLQILFGLCLQVVLGIYSAFCVSRYGGTPGKRICDLRVVRGNGEPVTFGRGFGRYCGKSMPRLIPIIGVIYMVVDALFICFDDQRRALHDQFADTRVIHKK